MKKGNVMKIQEIECKSIITKSNLPEVDYCINPYIGCSHHCVYCYARFMKRFTGHIEEWGEFLDIKINAPEILEKQLSCKFKRGTVLLGSVSDVYQPIEKKYEITRKILKILLKHDFPVSILTKSDLVLRDIDLLKQFNECEVGLTITSLDDNASCNFELGASDPQKRVNALIELKKTGIKTYAFIGPIIPEITNLHNIFSKLKDKVDYAMVESLNLRCGNKEDVKKVIQTKYPKFIAIYEKGFNKEYWDQVEQEVKRLSKEFGIPLKGFYRH